VRSVLCGLGAATALWFVLFSPWTRDAVPFWVTMAGATCLLAGYALWQQRGTLRRGLAFRPIWLAPGLAGAAALYGVFFVGRHVALALFDPAGDQVGQVYALRMAMPDAVLIPLLALWIAPAEEIFWRGFLQQRLAEKFGRWRGYLAAAGLYAAVHVWAFNPMLLAAALICGLFWGWMFARWRSLWPGIISHAVWDVAVFVLLPLQ